jgi:hypothetical protein
VSGSRVGLIQTLGEWPKQQAGEIFLLPQESDRSQKPRRGSFSSGQATPARKIDKNYGNPRG